MRGQQRHRLARDVDYSTLRDQLSARLGRPVELVARPPGDDGEPGELVVCCAETQEPLRLDPAVVRAVVANAPDRPEYRSNEQVTLDDLDAADDVDGQVAAIRGYLERLVAEEKARMVPPTGGGLVDVFAAVGSLGGGPS
jgi:hypothetical protein